MGNKTYGSVEEMIQDLSVDSEFKKEALQEIKNRALSRFLSSLRCSQGLKQKEMAAKMGCTQSRISKIENAHDKDISVKDLLEYGDVLDLKLEIGFRKQGEVEIVDLIKYHAFKIRDYLDTLAKLAGKDKTMVEGVSAFFGEAFFNMVNIIQDSASKLKKTGSKEKPKAPIYISSPLQEDSNAYNKEKELANTL